MWLHHLNFTSIQSLIPILAPQAQLKLKAEEMDERREEVRRVENGEESVIETILSDEVSLEWDSLAQELFSSIDVNILNAGFPLACWQGSLAQGEWWNWYRARWSFGEVRNLKQVQLSSLLVLVSNLQFKHPAQVSPD